MANYVGSKRFFSSNTIRNRRTSWCNFWRLGVHSHIRAYWLIDSSLQRKIGREWPRRFNLSPWEARSLLGSKRDYRSFSESPQRISRKHVEPMPTIAGVNSGNYMERRSEIESKRRETRKSVWTRCIKYAKWST